MDSKVSSIRPKAIFFSADALLLRKLKKIKLAHKVITTAATEIAIIISKSSWPLSDLIILVNVALSIDGDDFGVIFRSHGNSGLSADCTLDSIENNIFTAAGDRIIKNDRGR